MKRATRRSVPFLFVVAALFAACSGSDDSGTDVSGSGDVTEVGPDVIDNGSEGSTDAGSGDQAIAKSKIRAIHLSPDAPAVDLFVNGGMTPAAAGLAFTKSTGYLDVDAGTYTFDISPAGKTAADHVLEVKDLALEGDKSYTAAAFGTLASIQALALGDDVTGIPAGSFRVRVIHAAEGVGKVDVWNIPAMGDPAKVISQLDFAKSSGTLDLPAGSYTLGIDVNADGTPDLVFKTPDLPAGLYLNVFAVKDGASVFLIAQLPDGTTARIDPSVIFDRASASDKNASQSHCWFNCAGSPTFDPTG